MFDSDIRVPYYIRGPGIKQKSNAQFIVSNVDVMPTVLDLADIDIPQTVDGKSFKSKILNNDDDNIDGDGWRDVFLVEFLAQDDMYFNVCHTWYEENDNFHGKVIEPSPFTRNNSLVWVQYGFLDNPGNNYRELRIINSTHNWAYAEYINYTFTENDKQNPWLNVLYDVDKDPWQLTNIYGKTNENIKTQLHEMLMQYGSCQGKTCP